MRRQADVTSKIMSAVRSRNTRPEMMLRSGLHRRGLRYTLHDGRFAGHPDLAFPGRRVAVFVDGDFWHGKGFRARGFRSLEAQFAHWRNSEWWLNKIQSNIARDKRQSRQLRRNGWRVVRVSESKILQDLEGSIRLVERALRARD